MWKKFELWATKHPIILSILSLLVAGVPAATGAYNGGFYVGSSTADAHWRSTLRIEVDKAVAEQLPVKCGEVTRQLNSDCARQIKQFEISLGEQKEQIASLRADVLKLSRRLDVISLHERLTDNATAILSALSAARERRDSDAERVARARLLSLVRDINRTNRIFAEWADLFDSVATTLFNRLQNGENVPADELISFLQSFVADGDRKRQAIQNEIDEAEKIKNNKP